MTSPVRRPRSRLEEDEEMGWVNVEEEVGSMVVVASASVPGVAVAEGEGAIVTDSRKTAIPWTGSLQRGP